MCSPCLKVTLISHTTADQELYCMRTGRKVIQKNPQSYTMCNMVFLTRFCLSPVADIRVIPSHFCLFKKYLLKCNIPGTTWGRPVTVEELMFADADSFEFSQNSFSYALQWELQHFCHERQILQLHVLICNLIFNHQNT